jgi:hypothetical protein
VKDMGRNYQGKKYEKVAKARRASRTPEQVATHATQQALLRSIRKPKTTRESPLAPPVGTVLERKERNAEISAVRATERADREALRDDKAKETRRKRNQSVADARTAAELLAADTEFVARDLLQQEVNADLQRSAAEKQRVRGVTDAGRATAEQHRLHKAMAGLDKDKCHPNPRVTPTCLPSFCSFPPPQR